MKLDVVKNTKKGIIQGSINRIATLFLPFIVQTTIIRILGMDYAGVKGLFSSILSVLSLSELGIGAAIVYNMYKPIAEDDISTLCALLNTYKKLYTVIGLVILLLGTAILPFLKYLIRGHYPSDINLQIIFFLFLINTVVSYWMYSYKSALLDAYQRTDIKNGVGAIVQILTVFFQIYFLIKTRNYYVFLCTSIFFTIVNNLIISKCVDKLYPDIKCSGAISVELKGTIKKNVYGLMVDKICGTSRNAFDCMFISAFIGLPEESVYTNYFMVLTACNSLTGVILNSLLGGVGNNIVTDDKQTNYVRMMNLHVLYLLISGWMTACMLCLYQPFMILWVGEKDTFETGIMVLFPVYFMIMKLGDIRSVYSDAAGLFWENRFRTILEAVANVILNLLFVILWGVKGVLIATIITLFFIGFLGSTYVIFKYYFIEGLRKYLFSSIFYFLIALIIGFLAYSICLMFSFDNILVCLAFRSLICISFVPLMFYIICFFRKDFKDAISFLKKAIKA